MSVSNEVRKLELELLEKRKIIEAAEEAILVVGMDSKSFTKMSELQAELSEVRKERNGAQQDLAAAMSSTSFTEMEKMKAELSKAQEENAELREQVHHLECERNRLAECQERQRAHIRRTKGLLGLPPEALLHEIEDSISKLSEYPLSHLNSQALTIRELQSRLDEEKKRSERFNTLLGDCGRALGGPLASRLPDHIREQRAELISVRERLVELKAENSRLQVAINAAAGSVDDAKDWLGPVREVAPPSPVSDFPSTSTPPPWPSL